MSPTPVLLLHPSSDWYGADRQLLALATGLDPSRYRAVVALPERGELADPLEAGGVEVVTEPMAALRRDMLRGRELAATAVLLARSRRRLTRLARERGAAIVHTNTSILLGGHGIARAAGARHVQHVREIYTVGGATGRLWPLLRRRLLRADAVVCVSEAAAAPLGGHERVAIIRDGVPRAERRADRAAARAALGIEDGRFVVAMVGRISDWKGQHVLVRALAAADLADIGTVAVVAGDAAPGQEHFRDELARLQESLGLDGRLRLIGFRRDLSDVLGAADAVALPSVHPDALPNAVLEAAAAGLPVVATATGGQPEILRNGATGRLVSPGDHAALGAALRELADDPASAERLGQSAASDVAARFSTERMLAAIQDVYDRVLR